MIDRKLVITGLAMLKEDYLMHTCRTNPSVIDRAIELLKEQESQFTCEKCGLEFATVTCPRCGHEQ